MKSEPNISLACFLLAATTAPSLAIWPEAKVMPMGDSITRGTNDINYPNGSIPGGYRRLLGENLADASLEFDFQGASTDNAFPGMDADHNGRNGYRTDEILEHLNEPDLPTYPAPLLVGDPDIILLKAGTNDILQNKPVATAAANLSTLIDTLTANSPGRWLYVSTVLPITQAWQGKSEAELNAKANQYNTEVRNLVTQYAGQGRKVKLVDMNTSIVLTDPDPSKNFFQPGDGIHPGQAGYNQMGQIWYDAITGPGSYFETPPAGAPGTPGSLSAAVISETRIRLNWADNSTDETGFKIERKTGANGTFSQISVQPPGTTSYDDADLSDQTEYIYRVRAINEVSHSPYGNEAGATTSATVDYGSWTLRFPAFQTLSTEERSAKADPNQDGVSNLLCYAFNLDPMAPVPAGAMPCIRWVAGETENEFWPFFQFRRNKSAVAEMQLQVSTSLLEESWEYADQNDATVEPIDGDDLTERVMVPMTNEGPNAFARLKITID